jgi:hypothetical protein
VELTLVLAALGASILKPDLDASLAEAEPLTQLLAHKGVRVVGLVEQPLELRELLQGEVRPGPALLAVTAAPATTAATSAARGATTT